MAASKKKAAKKPARKAAPKAAKAPAKKTKPAKKAAAKPAKKKPAAKKSAAPTKKAAKSAAKTPAKKAGKKTAGRVVKSAAKKQAPAAQSKKKAAAKAPEKAAKTVAAPEKADSATKKDAAPPAKKAAEKKPTPKGKLARSGATGKKARPKKPILPVGPRHPKLGFKWICFSCTAKFYDLGREQPICPKCETNQLDRPHDDPKQTSDGPKLKVVRPMAQLLDDEEPAPTPDDEMAMDKKPDSPTEEMFDETAGEAVGLDIDEEADPDGTAEPPEIDVV